MKIYINDVNENWIVDRFKYEWEEYHKNTIANNISDSDIVWIISPWTFKKIKKSKLDSKIVLCTVHHLDLDNFSIQEYRDFLKVDQYVDYYHVLSSKTMMKLQKLTNKKIYVQPFWVNNKIWFHKENSSEIRKSLGFESEDFLVGSFQRDTEGKDLKSPKLIKGPDIFAQILDTHFDKKNTTVVLTGKRRQYIITKLEQLGIKYRYFEMVDFEKLNNLYNILDLYIVTSRLEGGPQQILECATIKTPVISTDVGIANKILSKESIFEFENFHIAKPNVDIAYTKVQQYQIPSGFTFFEKIFKEISKL
tara:strand:+ start:24961 stop:25881 length:921 start_codon:yes stop_codon:yes gene_type:complete